MADLGEFNYRAVSANFTLPGTTDEIVVVSASCTVTLPAASTQPAGRRFDIVNTSSGTITVAPNGTDNINGANSNDTSLTRQNQKATFLCDGSANWYRQDNVTAQNVPVSPASVPAQAGDIRMVSSGAGNEYLQIYSASQGGTVRIKPLQITLATLSPAAVAANTTAEQSFVMSAPWTSTTTLVSVQKPTAQAGLGIVGFRSIDSTHLGITFSNNTGSSITPTASENYTVVLMGT